MPPDVRSEHDRHAVNRITPGFTSVPSQHENLHPLVPYQRFGKRQQLHLGAAKLKP